MAKYSKEQRDRAVDLYIKYERCAAAESSSAGSSRSFLRKRGFAGVSMGGFIGMLDGYMVWYRDRRIKTEFGMSIMARRGALGLAA